MESTYSFPTLDAAMPVGFLHLTVLGKIRLGDSTDTCGLWDGHQLKLPGDVIQALTQRIIRLPRCPKARSGIEAYAMLQKQTS